MAIRECRIASLSAAFCFFVTLAWTTTGGPYQLKIPMIYKAFDVSRAPAVAMRYGSEAQFSTEAYGPSTYSAAPIGSYPAALPAVSQRQHRHPDYRWQPQDRPRGSVYGGVSSDPRSYSEPWASPHGQQKDWSRWRWLRTPVQNRHGDRRGGSPETNSGSLSGGSQDRDRYPDLYLQRGNSHPVSYSQERGGSYGQHIQNENTWSRWRWLRNPREGGADTADEAKPDPKEDNKHRDRQADWQWQPQDRPTGSGYDDVSSDPGSYSQEWQPHDRPTGSGFDDVSSDPGSYSQEWQPHDRPTGSGYDDVRSDPGSYSQEWHRQDRPTGSGFDDVSSDPGSYSQEWHRQDRPAGSGYDDDSSDPDSYSQYWATPYEHDRGWKRWVWLRTPLETRFGERPRGSPKTNFRNPKWNWDRVNSVYSDPGSSQRVNSDPGSSSKKRGGSYRQQSQNENTWSRWRSSQRGNSDPGSSSKKRGGSYKQQSQKENTWSRWRWNRNARTGGAGAADEAKQGPKGNKKERITVQPSSKQKDAMITLGLNHGFTKKDLKSCFKKMVKELHPDHGGDPEEFLKFKAAYDYLSE